MRPRVTLDTLEAYLAYLAPEDRRNVQEMSVQEQLDLIQILLDDGDLQPLPDHGGYLKLIQSLPFLLLDSIAKGALRALVLAGSVIYLCKFLLPLLAISGLLVGMLAPPVPTRQPELYLQILLKDAQDTARKAFRPSLDPFDVYINSTQIDLAMHNMTEQVKDALRIWGSYSTDEKGCRIRDELFAAQAGLLAISGDMETLNRNLTTMLRSVSSALNFTTNEFSDQAVAPDTAFASTAARRIWAAVRLEPLPTPAEMRERALWDTVCTGRRRLMTIAEEALDGAILVSEELSEVWRTFNPAIIMRSIELENLQADASDAQRDDKRFEAAARVLLSLGLTDKHMRAASYHASWLVSDLRRLYYRVVLPVGVSGHALDACDVDPAGPAQQNLRARTSAGNYLDVMYNNWAALAHSVRDWREKDLESYMEFVS